MLALSSAGRADDHPAVRLELADCLVGARAAIEHAIEVELGPDALAPAATAVTVGIDCVPSGLVVLEIRPHGAARRYRYALDWRSQPDDARPRLLGLAVAEALAASRIELVPIAEPAVPALAAVAPVVPARPARWALAVLGQRRAFTARAGVDLVGAGLRLEHQLTARLYLAADAVVEGTTALTTSGAVSVASVSSAPIVLIRTGSRVVGELGLGVRAGIARLRGEALPGGLFVGVRAIRPWVGPVTALALGVRLTPKVTVSARGELGWVVTGATARDLGMPVAVIDRGWTAFQIAAAIAL